MQELINLIGQGNKNHAGKTIVHIGHVWIVERVGIEQEGNTFCLLISAYGKTKRTITDWVDTAVLNASK